MRISGYRLLPVETGRFALDGGAMFGVIPKTLWNRTYPADEENRIDLALRSLLIQDKGRNILVDTGIGYKFSEKWRKIYKIDHSQYSLEKGLSAYQLTVDDITDVIITHLHFDHAGGATRMQNGKTVPTFTRATYYIQREQWQWAHQPTAKDKASFLKENFSALEAEGALELLDGSSQIFPGIEAMICHGHTPGMQLLKIADEQHTLVYCADLIPTATHIPIPWVMAYDNQPLVTMHEKEHLLDQVVQYNWFLFFEHDPVRPAGRVIKDDKGFRLTEDISEVKFIEEK